MPKRKSSKTKSYKKSKIPWEYCECGCKGWNVNVAGNYFSLYWDLKDGYYLAEECHDARLNGEKYSSWAAADKVVLNKLKSSYEQLRKIFE